MTQGKCRANLHFYIKFLFQLQPDLLHPDLPDPPGGDGALLPADGEEAVGGEDHWGGHSLHGKE